LIKRKGAIVAFLLIAGAAMAQTTSYTVRQGDTLSAIAARYNTTASAIAKASGISSNHKLKIGMKLSIPGAPQTRTASTPAGGGTPGTYVVRNGDHDWAIARKFNITVKQLHDLNPGIDWRKLQVGTTLKLSNASRTAAKPAAAPAQNNQIVAKGVHIVKEGENDWIIARLLGITPTQLHQLNPGVDWARLQIGQKLNTPKPTAVAQQQPQPQAAPARIESRHAIIAKDNVVVRKTPKENGARVTTTSAGTKVTVLSRDNNWYKLQFPRGTVGWVRGDLLREAPAPAPTVAQGSRNTRNAPATKAANTVAHAAGAATTLLERAFALQGIRYRYGGMSRSGYDCSGFTSAVFAAEGIKLPRTSAAQSKFGQHVDRQEMRAGDLVFFATRAGRGVSHVGIYIGGGRFIHSSSGGGKVQIDTLTSGYYQRRFTNARRVLNKAAVVPKTAVAKAPEKPIVDPEEEATPPEAIPARSEHPPTPPVTGADTIVR
jgi:cell wall-associated NlpC family hydrolase